MPRLPHPHLIVLRCAATLVLSALIAQAGWASAFLGGETHYLRYHAVGAWVTVATTVLSAVVYVVLRRSAGVVNVTLALVVAVGVVVQLLLGEASGHRALHIFLGILLTMLGTALTSWTYRHQMPEPARLPVSRPAPGPG